MTSIRLHGLKPRLAAEALQGATIGTAALQPLPKGQGGRASAASVGVKPPTGDCVFYVIGDHGGVKAPGPQNAVAYAMEAAAVQDKPAFVYSVGDVVYFNGDESEYGPQFYEPYARLVAPFLAIPGNHDGDTTDDPSRKPLDTFMLNFCQSLATIPAADQQLEYGRHTQTQPYCYWTLADSGLPMTIIGLYTNVPSGGHVDQAQQDWLTGELKAADPKKPVIVALHHPPYSVDAHHGGSQKMGHVLDTSFQAAGRSADLVLAGHVHDYQRFTRSYLGKKALPYVVIGNSGYHNLHRLAPDASPGSHPSAEVTFEHGEDRVYGYLKLTVSGGKVDGEFVAVKPGTMPDGSDAAVTPHVDAFTT